MINTKFNAIETIRTDSTIINKSAAYITACNSFEKEASKFASNTNFICRKSAEEVSLAYAKAQTSNCEYSVYTAAHACECWLKKAWNMED